MLVGSLPIFATLAVTGAALGVPVTIENSDIPVCVVACFTNTTTPTGPESGCIGLHVLLSQTHWTSFPHSLFLSSTDVACVCNNQTFINTTTSCIEKNCTGEVPSPFVGENEELCGG